MKIKFAVLVLLAAIMAHFLPTPDHNMGLVKEVGVFDLKAYDSSGRLLWSEEAYNSLSDEGEQLFLDCTLRATSCPSTFYVRLSDATSPCSITDTSTVTGASVGEPTGNGYAPSTVTRDATGWPTLALDSGDYMATSSPETFTASGGSFGPVYCVFLSTSSDNTGKLVSYAALSQARTLASGESLQVTYRVKLQ